MLSTETRCIQLLGNLCGESSREARSQTDPSFPSMAEEPRSRHRAPGERSGHGVNQQCSGCGVTPSCLQPQ